MESYFLGKRTPEISALRIFFMCFHLSLSGSKHAMVPQRKLMCLFDLQTSSDIMLRCEWASLNRIKSLVSSIGALLVTASNHSAVNEA